GHDAGVELSAVVEGDLDPVGLLDHVVGGEDVAVLADEDAGPGAEAAARAGFAAGVEGSAGGGPGQGRGPGLDLDVDHGGEDALDGGAERLAGGDGGGRTG